jgi:hypothetical protein
VFTAGLIHGTYPGNPTPRLSLSMVFAKSRGAPVVVNVDAKAYGYRGRSGVNGSISPGRLSILFTSSR